MFNFKVSQGSEPYSHKHNCQGPAVYNPVEMGRDFHYVNHTCPDLSDLTDAKIAGMGLSELIRIQGQLQNDIYYFSNEYAFGVFGSPDRRSANNSGLCKDNVNLEIIKNAIEQRKQKIVNDAAEIAQLKLSITNLSAKVKELENTVLQLQNNNKMPQ